MLYRISKKEPIVFGAVTLSGSKSISNRVLLIRALCEDPFVIEKLATASDTTTLQTLLAERPETWDVGAAGTSFRFLTAYLAFQSGTQFLTGSPRMLRRPIRPLVDALRQIGANIDYLEKEGYPPLRISEATPPDQSIVTLSAEVSSQFVSALLMVAPTLPNGLKIQLTGPVVSAPYIEMTRSLMQYFGVASQWEGDVIQVDPQVYRPRDITVESDWSAASYYYAMAALSDETELILNGLHEKSLQGDAVLSAWMKPFGVDTTFEENRIVLRKIPAKLPARFECDFLPCPDLAQTIIVLCASLGLAGRFSGLDTLPVKETDRITALQIELSKIGISLTAENPTMETATIYLLSGRPHLLPNTSFATYDDHRMAMALAPIGLRQPIFIQNPEVVSKSYPGFWNDLKQLGFEINLHPD